MPGECASGVRARELWPLAVSSQSLLVTAGHGSSICRKQQPWVGRKAAATCTCVPSPQHTWAAALLQEYAAWKERQLKEGAEAKKQTNEKLTEKKLKQAVLSFAAGSGGGSGGGNAGQQADAAADADTAAAAPKQQRQQSEVAGRGGGEGASPPKQTGGSKAGGSRPKGRTPSKKAALAQKNS